MAKKTKVWAAVMVILAAAGTAYQLGWGWTRPTVAVTAYEKYVLTRGDLSLTVVGNGKVVSGDVKTVMPVGAVSELSVKVGDAIKKGDPLAKYVDAMGKLRNFVSDYDGIVTAIPSGGLLTVGRAASSNFEISSKSVLQMDVQITEKEIYRVKPGQQASVYIEALNRNVEGKVARISYAGNTDKDYTLYRVTVSLANDHQDIFLGMTGSAKIAVENKQGVYKVPADAVIEEGGKSYILKSDWLNHKNKPKQDYYMQVTTGLSDTDYVELTSGGSDGLEVLILPDESTGLPRMMRH